MSADVDIYVGLQTARQVDRQPDKDIDTQIYGDLINWGGITLCLGCGRILV